ncbi:MAG: hypothetical protein ACIALR_01760, partial [Blastopirellula sp. JB062]
MKPLFFLFLALALQTQLVVSSAAEIVDNAAGVRLPAGFRATLFADDDLAHDIYAMTLDSRGRVVVAGAGYVKTLHDDDADGRADRATLFSDVPRSGAHGMAFRGNDLYCSGDFGLLRLSDVDRDGKADDVAALAQSRHPEHGTNGVVVGPDGWVYVICGNDANIFERHVTTDHSPVEHPQTGALFRVDPQTHDSEVVAHGFRNPYDFAFDAQGRMLTVDADGERDQHLPWYAPNRLFEIGAGRHHGWVLRGWRRSWNRPASFFDSRERLVEIGRGSPTGVATYRHTAFPQKYCRGVFSCCWTLGRIYFFPLIAEGAGLEATQEIFLETTDDSGIAPVDIAVGPSGEMYLAIGGRGTRGGVYRIEYVGEKKESSSPEKLSPIDAVLSAPQPLAAWSYAKWAPLANELGRATFLAAALDERRPAAERIRAIEIVTELFGGLHEERTITQLLQSQSDEVVARTAWSLSCRRDDVCPTQFYALTHHSSPLVRRAAWEGIASAAAYEEQIESCHWDSLGDPDRRVRAAALSAVDRILPRMPAATLNLEGSIAAMWLRTASSHPNSEEIVKAIELAVDRFENSTVRHEREDAIRVVQIALGDITGERVEPDVYAGYSPGRPRMTPLTMWDPLATRLDPLFPVGIPSVDREMARTLAMIQQPASNSIENFPQFWTSESTIEDDLHYLICLSRIPGGRTAELIAAEAAAYLRLHAKIEAAQITISRNWPLRVSEAFAEELSRAPELADAMLASEDFGRLEHSLFAVRFDPSLQRVAMNKILSTNDVDDIEAYWPDEMMPLLDSLPKEERLEILRARWDDYNMRHAVLARLGAAREAADRQRFVDSLLSANPASIVAAAEILRKMPADQVADRELLTAMKALRSAILPGQPVEQSEAIAALLRYWTSAPRLAPPSPAGEATVGYQHWFEWFAANYPQLNQELFAYAADEASWKQRLLGVTWEKGDAMQGAQIFAARGCKQCHVAAGRLGPSLKNITGRFRQYDLFMAIVDPNRDVSPAYHTTQVMTRSGKSFIGTIIYESPAGTLIQTGPGVTERILEDEIILRRPSRRSMMPV